MTEQTIALKGEQWKQLALLSYTQLVTHLQSIPGNIETGDAGINDQHLAAIDAHLAEARLFLRSWRASKIPIPQVEQVEVQANGAAPVAKKRGGWPKGKKRNASAEAVQ